MQVDSQSALIPLPFATAGIALFVSYLFPRHIGGIEASLFGFAVGIALLYLDARFEAKGGRPRASDVVRCPKCGAELHISVSLAFGPKSENER